MAGLLQTAALVRQGKLKLADVPEPRRKKIQRLIDDYGPQLDAVGREPSIRIAPAAQPHVRTARTA